MCVCGGVVWCSWVECVCCVSLYLWIYESTYLLVYVKMCVYVCMGVSVCKCGMYFHVNVWVTQHWKTDRKLFLDSVGGGVWPFLVGGLICVVDSTDAFTPHTHTHDTHNTHAHTTSHGDRKRETEKRETEEKMREREETREEEVE